ncbi:MAG: response regulator [Oscillospiraceae bacterium]|nr:response regulator [Oscillospiraceae bacterium]
MPKKKIVLVDDNPANLSTCKKTLKDLYEVFPTPSAAKMFEILQHITPDLILLDVEMPEMNGYEAMKLLKSDDAYKNIPVMFLSAMDDAESEMVGLKLGAVDYIHKPIVGALLTKRIDTHLSLIERKKELLSINRMMKTKERDGGSGNGAAELADKVRTPLISITHTLMSSLQLEDINDIKNNLKKMSEETKLIFKTLDDFTN